MKRYLPVRSIMAALVLFQVFVVALYFRRDDTPLRSLVSVEEQAYYLLPISGRDTLYFAMASDSDLVSGVRDSVFLLRSLHTRSKAARHTVTRSGYRVNHCKRSSGKAWRPNVNAKSDCTAAWTSCTTMHVRTT